MSLDKELILFPRVRALFWGELTGPAWLCNPPYRPHPPWLPLSLCFPHPLPQYIHMPIMYAIGDAYRTCFSTGLPSSWNEAGGVMLLVNKSVHWDSKHWVWADFFFSINVSDVQSSSQESSILLRARCRAMSSSSLLAMANSDARILDLLYPRIGLEPGETQEMVASTKMERMLMHLLMGHGNPIIGLKIIF